MTDLRVGQFVKSLANDLGLGKIADVDDEMVVVEYFDGPSAQDQPRRTLPKELVQPSELRQERRVYFKHPATQVWFVGRALIKTGDSYRIQFPNRKVGELPESALFVRWDQPLKDPTEHLAYRVNETPYFYEGRAPFRQSLIAQRAGCASMTGHLSSVVELEEHQIEVVRRALGDPIRRHLLADEPGLGKTIEAGAIMRQYALENPGSFEIVVAVARPLCAQWEDELSRRFLFEQELGERVFVVPHDDLATLEAHRSSAAMFIVDDAHRIAQMAHAHDLDDRAIYEAYRQMTGECERVLLLSSMAASEDQRAYRAMLHLLAPEAYELDSDAAVGFSDRVLRTAQTEAIDWLSPGRGEAEVAAIEVGGQADLEAKFEKWRQGAAAAVDGDDEASIDEWTALFRQLVEGLCGPCQGLVNSLEDRRQQIADGQGLPAFDGEDKLLAQMAESAAEMVRQGVRRTALVELLSQLDDGERAIVFAGDKMVADQIWEFLRAELDVGVVRHDIARHVHECEWRQFLDDPDRPILVCDHRAEEGFNFQSSQARLIHLHLPTSAVSMEQRLGRLDRYGTGRAVVSTCFRPVHSRWVEALLEFYDEGCQLFERSLASVRWSLAAKTDALWREVFTQGLSQLRGATDALGGPSGWLAERLEAVAEDWKEQSLAPASEEGASGQFYDRLWDVDFDGEGLEEAAHEWIGNRLQFHRVYGEDQRTMRYEYRTESTAKHPTLLAISELLGRFSAAVDPGVNGFFSYPLSFHRGTANSLQVRVARLGEPFMTAMNSYVRHDDRGVSYAMWRHIPREKLSDDPGVYFRFDFVVDADTTAAEALLDEESGAVAEAARIRADYFFPPRVHTLWVRGDGGPVRDAHVLELLEMPYESDGANRYGRDYNLNPTRWEIIEEFYDQHAWQKSCREAREEAQELLAGGEKLAQEATEAAEMARQSDLFGDQGRPQWEAAIADGIASPRLELDAIGAVFLSTVSPFEE